jgi:dTDP-glucose 4,6-dehydratase
MRLFITGGAGFIGSNFIRHLLATHPDYKIINFDKLTYAGNLDNLRDISDDENYSFVRGDICDRRAIDEAIRGSDAVINFAAESHVDRSIERATDFIETNVVGTQILLDAARAARVSRFVQISTDEVQGSCKEDECFTDVPQ